MEAAVHPAGLSIKIHSSVNITLSPLLGLFPKGIDIGDLLLFAILLLMYLESGDEECLIILAVLFLMK